MDQLHKNDGDQCICQFVHKTPSVEGGGPARSLMDILREKRKSADSQRKHASIENERQRVLEILREGPATTREISERLDLIPSRVRLRVHQLGCVQDNTGRWGLTENL